MKFLLKYWIEQLFEKLDEEGEGISSYRFIRVCALQLWIQRKASTISSTKDVG